MKAGIALRMIPCAHEHFDLFERCAAQQLEGQFIESTPARAVVAACQLSFSIMPAIVSGSNGCISPSIILFIGKDRADGATSSPTVEVEDVRPSGRIAVPKAGGRLERQIGETYQHYFNAERVATYELDPQSFYGPSMERFDIFAIL